MEYCLGTCGQADAVTGEEVLLFSMADSFLSVVEDMLVLVVIAVGGPDLRCEAGINWV